MNILGVLLKKINQICSYKKKKVDTKYFLYQELD